MAHFAYKYLKIKYRFLELSARRIFAGMVVRKKKNMRGSISVQVIEKYDGKSVLVKTIGSSADSGEIEWCFK